MTIIDSNQARAALREVVDPELDCNIVDLGLVYDIAIEDSRVEVTMTVTTPGCPMQEIIVAGVRNVLGQLPGIEEVAVRMVWDPPWTPDRMTAYGRERIGLDCSEEA